MKVGILGGGFDPPHWGHIKAGLEAIDKKKIDEAWLVPYNKRNLEKAKGKSSSSTARLVWARQAKRGEQKAKVTNKKQRLEMTRLAIRGQRKFKVLDIEIKRKGVSYTIDTTRELKDKYPHHEFYLIIGEDLREELPKWHLYEKLAKEIKFIFIKNKTDKKGRKISSREIRKRANKGLSIKGLVTVRVEKYIYQYKLYI